MDVLGFIREYLDIRKENRNYCKSCETLQSQLAQANHEKKMLLEQILHKPEPAQPIQQELPQRIEPRVTPWHIKRQMLEAEDRARAMTIRRQQEDELKAKESNKQSQEISVEELEKELAIGDE